MTNEHDHEAHVQQLLRERREEERRTLAYMKWVTYPTPNTRVAGETDRLAFYPSTNRIGGRAVVRP